MAAWQEGRNHPFGFRKFNEDIKKIARVRWRDEAERLALKRIVTFGIGSENLKDIGYIKAIAGIYRGGRSAEITSQRSTFVVDERKWTIYETD